MTTTLAITSLILEHSLIAAIVVTATGIVAAYALNARAKAKPAIITIIATAAAALAIYILGSTFVTPTEQLKQRTARYVNAIAEADPGTIESMTASRFVIAADAEEDFPEGREWLINITAGMDEAINSNDLRITDVTFQSRDAAIVRFVCRTEITEMAMTVGSTWELTWQRFEGDTPDAWQAIRLECFTINGQRPSRQFIGWGNRYRR